MVKYFKGDLFASDCNIVCHQCNCKGAYNAGIAKTIRTLYPVAYTVFMERYNAGEAKLGEIDIVPFLKADGDIRYIINMYAQYAYGYGDKHTDYVAFQTCLNQVRNFIDLFNNDVIKLGFPAKIGCGLAGGDWNIVRKIIEDTFADSKYHVEVWEI